MGKNPRTMDGSFTGGFSRRSCTQGTQAHGAGRQDWGCPPGCAQARYRVSPSTQMPGFHRGRQASK